MKKVFALLLTAALLLAAILVVTLTAVGFANRGKIIDAQGAELTYETDGQTFHLALSFESQGGAPFFGQPLFTVEVREDETRGQMTSSRVFVDNGGGVDKKNEFLALVDHYEVTTTPCDGITLLQIDETCIPTNSNAAIEAIPSYHTEQLKEGEGDVIWMIYLKNGDTLRLHPAVFRGKRNRRYTDRARFYGDAPVATGREVAAGQPVAYSVEISRDEAPWLWQGRVKLDAEREGEGCCEVEPMPAAHIGHFAYVPPFSPALAPVADNTGKAGELQRNNPVLQHISKYRPYDGSPMEGALLVHFPLDKHTLLLDFRDNAATLDRIVSITKAIMADSTSAVKIIQIVGLASVDGPMRHNIALAGRRVKVLKDYVQGKVATPDSLYETVNGGEGWPQLRRSIAAGSSPWRDRLLSIIDNEPNADRREQMIKRLDGRRAYRWLKDSVLGDQRNSGYMRIYYDYKPDTVAAVINRATELLGQGRADEARRMLLTVSRDERSHNALGVACYMTGRRDEAIGWLRRAADKGNADARENLRQYEAIRKAEELNK